MSMQMLRRAGVIAALAGCGSAPPATREASVTQEDAVAVRELQAVNTRGRCPDGSTDCTQTNGTGVYTAEGGYAGIDTGEAKLMITHFMNNAGSTGTLPSVTFQGRYYDARSPLWLAVPLSQPGVVVSADYLGRRELLVASVTETATMPTWTLLDPTTQPPAAVIVTGPALGQLELHIQFADRPDSLHLVRFALAFDQGTAAPGNRTTLQQYAMTWRNMSGTAAARPYCFRDAVTQQHVDPVVFQQGIDVDPVNGRVTRSSATAGVVTMSCFFGAPATVYRWGYSYRAAGTNPAKPSKPSVTRVHPDPTFYFDAGIQMKRASYCADETYHTVAGTHIEIDDDWPVLQNRPTKLEAFWTPMGASCLNYVRIPVLKFSGECGGKPLPKCPALPPAVTPAPPVVMVRGPDAYLADGLP